MTGVVIDVHQLGRPSESLNRTSEIASAVRANIDDSARSPHDICGPVAEIPILTEVQQERTSIPLWHTYCPEKVHSAEDKCAFATHITDLYSEVGLPPFYVSVAFHELSRDSFFVGGKPTNDSVRIWIDYIARSPSPVRRQWWIENIDDIA